MSTTVIVPLQKPTVNAVVRRTAAAPGHHIQTFFTKYPTFKYNVTAPFLEEFQRLCKTMKWKKDSGPKERAQSALRTAMVKQFNRTYGRDANDLASWQQLCNALGGAVPNEIEDCKELLARTHVNIVDFVQAPETAKPVPNFPTEAELSQYTKKYKKYFPREKVSAGSLLECLLRHIRTPRPPRKSYASHPRNGSRGSSHRRGRGRDGG
ncbi:hypothetical protein LXA43DRAFT_1003704 [Ganoderma leucocontextum]|nr:hypothetical protein LXA43DRAFT_1003704 [Ganoderma leucocontextum]